MHDNEPGVVNIFRPCESAREYFPTECGAATPSVRRPFPLRPPILDMRCCKEGGLIMGGENRFLKACLCVEDYSDIT